MKLETTQKKNTLKTNCCNENLRVKYFKDKKTLLGDRCIEYFYCAGCLIACDSNLNVIGSHSLKENKLIPN